MNIISIDNYRASQRIHPLSLLAQMSSRRANGCLRVSDGSTSWWIYLNNGDLVHASHSVAPFKRLERHLRQMNQDAPSLSPTVRGQAHQLFNTVPEQDIEWLKPPDYQAIRWLVDKGHLTVPQAATLLDSIAKEVFETFLQVREGVHELVECPEFMSSSLLCLLELRPLVEACQQELRQGGMRPRSTSTYISATDDSVSTGQTAIDSDVPSLSVQRSADAFNASPVMPAAHSDSESSLKVEAATQSESDLAVESVSLEGGAFESDVAESTLARDKREILPFGKEVQSPGPSSPFRPTESHFQAPEQRQPDPIFSNLSRQVPSTADSSTSQFGAPSTQPMNVRRPGVASPSNPRGSVPTGTSSSQTYNGRRSSSVARPTSPSSTSSKITQNPPFYRDNKDKTDINQRPSSAKQPFRSSGGYPSSSGISSLGNAKPQGEKMYKVACIDDSPMILHMIEAFLEDKSFAVIKINDPVRALMELMRAKPDIILLDITMPNLDGYELCALLRSRPDFRNTPIIMVTGSKGLIDRAKARLVKASGYLTKPFNQTQLLKMIFKLLK